MVEKDFIIRNKLGLHARPAGLLVQAASKFRSKIAVRKGDAEVNAKSIMGLMMLAAECGSTVTLTFEGPDEGAAAEALGRLFEKDEKFLTL